MTGQIEERDRKGWQVKMGKDVSTMTFYLAGIVANNHFYLGEGVGNLPFAEYEKGKPTVARWVAVDEPTYWRAKDAYRAWVRSGRMEEGMEGPEPPKFSDFIGRTKGD